MSDVEITDGIGQIMPEIVHKGVYTLWKKPDGTLRVQYHRDDKDEEDFFELPGAIVAMTETFASGKMSPAEMMKATMKMMTSMRPPKA
jgi:hypothetical protein